MEEDAELKLVKSMLRSVLISSKEGVPATKLNSKFASTVTEVFSRNSDFSLILKNKSLASVCLLLCKETVALAFSLAEPKQRRLFSAYLLISSYSCRLLLLYFAYKLLVSTQLFCNEFSS